jgi:preprotein translocase subunit SecA
MGLDGESTTEEAIEEAARNRDVLTEHLQDLVEARLEAREQEHGEEVWAQVERFVLLRTIDSLWVEHLTELDDMRRGIGLRGYAQQDPLNEFRKEAFRLYEELRDLIRRQVAASIFRVTVKREPPTQPLSGPGQPARPSGDGAAATPDGHAHTHDHAPSVTSGSATSAGGGGTVMGRPGGITSAGTGLPATPRAPGLAGLAGLGGAAPIKGLPADPMKGAREVPGDAAVTGQARTGFTPSGARIGRNDPCWCGSGQKYKKCHGA